MRSMCRRVPYRCDLNEGSINLSDEVIRLQVILKIDRAANRSGTVFRV